MHARMYMSKTYPLTVALPNNETKTIVVKNGEILYVLGANGTGKSSLITRFFGQHIGSVKRIAAHRQTWFDSNTLDLTPRHRQDLENNVRDQDRQLHARYREWNPAGRANMAIFDLIDADTMQERKIASFVRSGNLEGAAEEAETPSPIEVINELMKLSNIPIRIQVEEGQKITASKNNGPSFSVAELSDGERNAFLIAADVLTAKSNTLILIDEPERHLHRSIVAPLLRLLLEKRGDCGFIISTHEIMLPMDTPGSSTLLVRKCEYEGQNVKSWDVDTIEGGFAIDEDLKKDILGSRRKIIYVEGATQSLDMPLYSLLFPMVSIVPKDGCKDVENAVRGLRSATDMHWVSAWGIIDRDQRTEDEARRLREAGIWCLSHYSVESLYYHPIVLRGLAQRQSQLTGEEAVALLAAAESGALEAAKNQKNHLVNSAVTRTVRNMIMQSLPTAKDVVANTPISVTIDVAKLRAAEDVIFDGYLAAKDFDALLGRYPLRESSAFGRVIDGLKMKDQATYRKSALKLIQEDETVLVALRKLLGDLHSVVNSDL